LFLPFCAFKRHSSDTGAAFGRPQHFTPAITQVMSGLAFLESVNVGTMSIPLMSRRLLSYQTTCE